MNSILKNALYVVATPIGNLGDISQRAIEILANVDKIAVEDSRHSKPLLTHLGISKPLITLHEHNEREQAAVLLAEIERGLSMAVISDAGTPLISDPGYHLVRCAFELGIKVIPIPGPSAVICALSASGLPTDHFCFEGFLPAKEHARRNALTALETEARTMVFYEAPHRILETLQDMAIVFGLQRKITMARELTKQFETIFAGTLQELIELVLSDANQQRGEIVLVVAGAAERDRSAGLSIEAENILKILLAELSVKQAAGLAAKITGISKNILYAAALTMSNENT